MEKKSRLRPMPDDFREVAATMNNGQDALKQHYRASYDTVVRWLHECGITSNYGRPAPDDLAEVLSTMLVSEACEHYRCASSTLMRWRLEAGLIQPGHSNKLPTPADFAQVAPTMTQRQLLAHYGITNHRVIKRWCAETGAQPMRREYTPPPRRTTARTGRAAGSSYLPMYDQQHKTRTIFDDAADTLRREHWVVYHCTETGIADLKGTFWRVGNVVCTDDELLVRAARYERKAA